MRTNNNIMVLHTLLLHNLLYTAQSTTQVPEISEIYRAALEKADITKNFLIAPKQIQFLLNAFKESAEQLSNSTATEHREQYEVGRDQLNEKTSVPSWDPIHVTNTIVTQDDRTREFYAEKLAQTKLNYQPDVVLPPSASMNNSTMVELVNSVSVQARWTFNFQKRDTYKTEFYYSPNDHIHFDSMHKDDVFNYGILEELNATALEMPLHHSQLFLLIVLPDERDGLAALEEQLLNYTLIEEIWQKRLRMMLSRVVVPKFKISYTIQLGNLLDVSGYDPKILNVLHEAQIEVSEDGLGQYLKNTVLFWNLYSSLRITPESFQMEHPFFFIIHDKKDIQFVGHLVNK